MEADYPPTSDLSSAPNCAARCSAGPGGACLLRGCGTQWGLSESGGEDRQRESESKRESRAGFAGIIETPVLLQICFKSYYIVLHIQMWSYFPLRVVSIVYAFIHDLLSTGASASPPFTLVCAFREQIV